MTPDTAHCCKVARSAARHDVSAIDQRLRCRRAAGDSLRELAAVVNRALLQSALTTVTIPMVGDPDGIYDVLTDDDVSAGRRAELRSQLERAGVDVDQLESDFVSHQTVRDHLRTCLDIDTSRSADTDVESARETIAWSRRRHESVVENTLDQLRSSADLQISEFTVTSTLRVTCDDCGESYHVQQLLDRGQCRCGTLEMSVPEAES